jgi:GSH-dependent disulfide-bond oxidoreductase
MIELYGAKTGNCLRVAIALEVCSIPYRVVHVNLNRGEQRSVAHLTLNPAGKVPTIVDHSRGDPPFVLSQSNAIMFYLSDLAPGVLMPRGGERQRAIVHERFFYFLTDVIGPSHAAFQLRRADATQSRDVLEQKSIASLMAAERFLLDDEFMGGGSLTLVDIAAFTIAKALSRHIDWDRVPRLREWFDSLKKQPAIDRGLRAFDKPPEQ